MWTRGEEPPGGEAATSAGVEGAVGHYRNHKAGHNSSSRPFQDLPKPSDISRHHLRLSQSYLVPLTASDLLQKLVAYWQQDPPVSYGHTQRDGMENST